MRINELKKYLLEERQRIIKQRDETRGTGVFLAENIDSYYMLIGEFYAIDGLCKKLCIKVDEYDPYETAEDDNKFNYCGALGPIGKIEND